MDEVERKAFKEEMKEFHRPLVRSQVEWAEQRAQDMKDPMSRLQIIRGFRIAMSLTVAEELEKAHPRDREKVELRIAACHELLDELIVIGRN